MVVFASLPCSAFDLLVGSDIQFCLDSSVFPWPAVHVGIRRAAGLVRDAGEGVYAPVCSGCGRPDPKAQMVVYQRPGVLHGPDRNHALSRIRLADFRRTANGGAILFSTVDLRNLSFPVYVLQ